MIISSANRLRTKRRQQRLARKAAFSFADFDRHHDRSEDHAWSSAFAESPIGYDETPALELLPLPR